MGYRSSSGSAESSLPHTNREPANMRTFTMSHSIVKYEVLSRIIDESSHLCTKSSQAIFCMYFAAFSAAFLTDSPGQSLATPINRSFQHDHRSAGWSESFTTLGTSLGSRFFVSSLQISSYNFRPVCLTQQVTAGM